MDQLQFVWSFQNSQLSGRWTGDPQCSFVFKTTKSELSSKNCSGWLKWSGLAVWDFDMEAVTAQRPLSSEQGINDMQAVCKQGGRSQGHIQ